MNANKYEKNALSTGSDAFSELLGLLRLDAEIYHNATVCGDWLINEHRIGATCFHLVTGGGCLLDVPDYLKVELLCGDLVIFPKELAHSMTPLTPQIGQQKHLSYQETKFLDSTEVGTGMLCAEVRFHHKSSVYLLDELPPVFIIPHNSDSPWMQSIFDMILAECLSQNTASKAILDKLSEILFTYALRQHLMENPDHFGFLALYSHERLNKAINAFHKQPAKHWTLETLAVEAALSRTVFVETFKSVSGWTVSQYLTWWRMQLAWSKLSEGKSVAEAADLVGYKSEAAFSRVFQKTFSMTAGQVRRGSNV